MKISASDFLKIPNLLSLSRIFLLIPFFIFFRQNDFFLTLAFILLIILTDYLDGWTSRLFNQVTELGKILDPLADKICLGAGLFIILTKAQIFLWPLYLLILRDLVIIAVSALIAKKLNEVPASNIFGKLTSLLLSLTGVLFFILPFYPAQPLEKVAVVLYYASTGFIFISFASYALKAYRLLKKR